MGTRLQGEDYPVKIPGNNGYARSVEAPRAQYDVCAGLANHRYFGAGGPDNMNIPGSHVRIKFIGGTDLGEETLDPFLGRGCHGPGIRTG